MWDHRYMYNKIRERSNSLQIFPTVSLNSDRIRVLYSHLAPDALSDPRPFDFNRSAFWGLLHVAISHVDL